MTDLEKEIAALQSMDVQGTVNPVQPAVVPVQTTQTIAQTQAVVQPQVAPVQTITTMAAPVVNNQQVVQPLNLDVAQSNIENNEFITIDMGKKVSTAVIEKLKGQKDEKKRVVIFMPYFDIPEKQNSAMAVKRHYNEDLGSFVCFNGECCQYEDKAVVRYLFPVVEYPLINGDPTKPLPENVGGECKLKLLVAGNELYSTISDAYAAHGNSFEGYDLIMTCTEQQYQNFTVMATNSTAKGNYPASFSKCVEKWKQVRDQAYTVVARKMDPEYYRNQKGIGVPQVNTVPTDLPSMDTILQ